MINNDDFYQFSTSKNNFFRLSELCKTIEHKNFTSILDSHNPKAPQEINHLYLKADQL